MDLQGEEPDTLLDEALAIRAFDILELLLKWGADPTKAGTESVIDTYRTDLIDRFWKAGVDYTADPGFVTYLAHSVKKPPTAEPVVPRDTAGSDSAAIELLRDARRFSDRRTGREKTTLHAVGT